MARGFVWFIVVTAGMMTLPLHPTTGKPTLWVMLPFLLTAIVGVWLALQRSARDRAVLAVLTLTPQQVMLVRRNTCAPDRSWQVNPYWASAEIYTKAGLVPDFLNLRGVG